MARCSLQRRTCWKVRVCYSLQMCLCLAVFHSWPSKLCRLLRRSSLHKTARRWKIVTNKRSILSTTLDCYANLDSHMSSTVLLRISESSPTVAESIIIVWLSSSTVLESTDTHLAAASMSNTVSFWNTTLMLIAKTVFWKVWFYTAIWLRINWKREQANELP